MDIILRSFIDRLLIAVHTPRLILISRKVRGQFIKVPFSTSVKLYTHLSFQNCTTIIKLEYESIVSVDITERKNEVAIVCKRQQLLLVCVCLKLITAKGFHKPLGQEQENYCEYSENALLSMV